MNYLKVYGTEGVDSKVISEILETLQEQSFGRQEQRSGSRIAPWKAPACSGMCNNFNF